MEKAPEQLRFAVVAVDVIIFGYHEGVLQVLIGKIHRPPHYSHTQGFPGGLLDAKETAEEAAMRIAKQKGAISSVYLEQLATFSALDRDKRNRVVSVAYLGLVRPDTVAGYECEGARFIPVQQIGSLAYDHEDMVHTALKRLQGKFSYTTIAQFLLPKHFTLSEMHQLYACVTGKEFDKRNFRKKILSLGILKDTGRVQEGVQNRPASLYTFTSNTLTELPLIA